MRIIRICRKRFFHSFCGGNSETRRRERIRMKHCPRGPDDQTFFRTDFHMTDPVFLRTKRKCPQSFGMRFPFFHRKRLKEISIYKQLSGSISASCLINQIKSEAAGNGIAFKKEGDVFSFFSIAPDQMKDSAIRIAFQKDAQSVIHQIASAFWRNRRFRFARRTFKIALHPVECIRVQPFQTDLRQRLIETEIMTEKKQHRL